MGIAGMVPLAGRLPERGRRQFALLALLAGFATAALFAIDEPPLSVVRANPPIEYSGLTKTLVSLLQSRAPSVIRIGTNRIAVEALFPDDTSSWFDCDAVMYEYLDSTEEPYYESLADRIENAIYEKFEGNEGQLFVHAEAEAEDENVTIGIYVHRSSLVRVPVELRASDGSFGVSFSVLRPLEYEANIELLLNTEIVNAESVGSDRFLDGMRIRIETLSLELGAESDDGDLADGMNAEMDEPVRFFIDGQEYPARISSCDIHSLSAWYLDDPSITDADLTGDDIDSDADPASDAAADAVACSRLKQGAYTFDELNESHIDLAIDVETGDPATVFRYSMDDLRSADAFEYIEFE